MKKKVLGLVLALAMTLTLAAPAFAANYYTNQTDSSELEQSVTFNALTFVPTIKLAAPTFTDSPIVLNPYKIQFTGSSNKLAGQAVNDSNDQYKQVICPVYAIKNQTDAPLKYTVEATTTPTNVTLQDGPVSVTETEKVASLQLVVATSETSNSDYTSGNYGNPANEQQLDQYDASKFEVLKLASGAVTSSESIEKCLAPGNGGSGSQNYLLFQFQGTMTRSPSVAWAPADKVDCVVKFTFTPDSANDYSLKSDKTLFTTTAKTIANSATDGTPSTAAFDIKLPSDTTGATDSDIIKADLDTHGAPAISYSATNANWALVSSGALKKAGVNVDSDAKKITITPAEACVDLPKDGRAHDYKLVVSFNDEHEIPRTLDFKIKLTRATS